MACKVFLTGNARRDLHELYQYIYEHDSSNNADYVLDRIEKVVADLSEFPERGSYPRELSALGIRNYREVFFKPYRIIYRIVEKSVFIYLIVDGRRDVVTLLQRRLFGV